MNAVTRMASSNLRGVEFIIVNTDEQVLSKSIVENKVQIGNKVTRGMGAGGDPEIGARFRSKRAKSSPGRRSPTPRTTTA
jgi:cell division protein FtsZ